LILSSKEKGLKIWKKSLIESKGLKMGNLTPCENAQKEDGIGALSSEDVEKGFVYVVVLCFGICLEFGVNIGFIHGKGSSGGLLESEFGG
jgi:hypothetical protein